VPAIARVFTSTISRVDRKSESLRVTIPAPVSALLGARAGEILKWTVEPGSGKISVSRGET
jgi:bifunctional DNA-binding transcriptional regulator/antitoxin component of YhaV-PrlF toxin-antitoxin module